MKPGASWRCADQSLLSFRERLPDERTKKNTSRPDSAFFHTTSERDSVSIHAHTHTHTHCADQTHTCQRERSIRSLTISTVSPTSTKPPTQARPGGGRPRSTSSTIRPFQRTCSRRSNAREARLGVLAFSTEKPESGGFENTIELVPSVP